MREHWCNIFIVDSNVRTFCFVVSYVLCINLVIKKRIPHRGVSFFAPICHFFGTRRTNVRLVHRKNAISHHSRPSSQLRVSLLKLVGAR